MINKILNAAHEYAMQQYGIGFLVNPVDRERILTLIKTGRDVSSERVYRHKKRGTEYVLIGIGKMQAEHWIDQHWTHQPESGEPPKPTWSRVDMREVAIYRSVTDPTEIWVRPREEFEDGRFEAQEELSDEEEDARAWMIEKGWRRASKEEQEQGFCTFQHRDGVQQDADSWIDLAKQDPDTSIEDSRDILSAIEAPSEQEAVAPYGDING